MTMAPPWSGTAFMVTAKIRWLTQRKGGPPGCCFSGGKQGLVKGEKFCFRNLDFYFQHGESTSTASQLTLNLEFRSFAPFTRSLGGWISLHLLITKNHCEKPIFIGLGLTENLTLTNSINSSTLSGRRGIIFSNFLRFIIWFHFSPNSTNTIYPLENGS